jgi:hypothetical protein
MMTLAEAGEPKCGMVESWKDGKKNGGEVGGWELSIEQLLAHSPDKIGGMAL